MCAFRRPFRNMCPICSRDKLRLGRKHLLSLFPTVEFSVIVAMLLREIRRLPIYLITY